MGLNKELLMSQSVCQAAPVLLIVQDVGDRSMQNVNYYSWTLLPMCLPSVFLTSPHGTKTPSPPPLSICILQVIETGGGNGLGMRPSTVTTLF